MGVSFMSGGDAPPVLDSCKHVFNFVALAKGHGVMRDMDLVIGL